MKIRLLLRRHAGAISFCGVAVVLATFIIKDVLRDKEKELLAAMETAQRAYDSTIANDSISVRLDRLLVLVSQFQKGPYPTIPNLEPSLQVRLDSRIKFYSLCKIIDERWTRLNNLLEESSPKRPQEFERIDNEFKVKRSQVEETGRLLSVADPSNHDFMEKLSKAGQTESDALDYLTHAEEQIIADLRKEATIAKSRLNWFTFWSYFLYPVGVLVGVLGQLAGAKPAESE